MRKSALCPPDEAQNSQFRVIVMSITEPGRISRHYRDEGDEEAIMRVAQVIRFEERQAIGRPRRKQAPAPSVILKFPSSASLLAGRMPAVVDEDRIAGRGRDPG